ncbi:UvrD-helicase domain-containing protein [Enterococcus avium]|uniref:UvrD-helicase domain-containing protein n=1 Tax=Enterococcus avium TaxID=33945 RepID=UPI0028926F4D|nr:UvrD-helicase domain-containing protein [Enterococcus avium]MDT2471679.1 UvrD-helicase domain-containing protein [Enterococcus avium]
MKIKIAGAGAGKTTKMAERIIDSYQKISDYQNIYCITFTNNAVDCIGTKLREHFGEIPQNIKLSTIHSFLNQEIIKPYYYILFNKQFIKVSRINLSNVPAYRRSKISQLEKENILHVSVFSERAKWVISKKSSDNNKERKIRASILRNFKKYCGHIFIDEAQDIDKNMLEIIKTFNMVPINIELIGDPKQDLKGTNSLRLLIEEFTEDVEYIKECYRCPQNHLDISNTLIPKSEWQYSEKSYGTISVIFQSDIDLSTFFNSNSFDLKYISEQNKEYSTKNDMNNLRFRTLFYEVTYMLNHSLKNKDELRIKQVAYYLTTKLISKFKETNNEKEAMKIISPYIKGDKQTYAKIISSLKIGYNEEETTKIFLSSIDSIKGQEGMNCLFVLTNDLAAYLFQEKKTSNKIKNRLYVALTRSLDKLSILISHEVEVKYGKDYIVDFFNMYTL